MASTTLIDLMRHGEPVGGSRFRGHTDDPLSGQGWRQMRRAVGDHNPWGLVVSSPLLRCRAFAEELSRRHGLELELEPRLKEIGFGCWEGCNAAEIQRGDPQALMRFYGDPARHTPDGAEPLDHFQQRISSAWDDLLAGHAGKHLLIVAHAGVIRMVVAQVLDLPPSSLFRINVANAGITRIQCDQNGSEWFFQLLFHGGVL